MKGDHTGKIAKYFTSTVRYLYWRKGLCVWRYYCKNTATLLVESCSDRRGQRYGSSTWNRYRYGNFDRLGQVHAPVPGFGCAAGLFLKDVHIVGAYRCTLPLLRSMHFKSHVSFLPAGTFYVFIHILYLLRAYIYTLILCSVDSSYI